MGNWDRSMKSLVAGCPLAFATLILRELNVEAHSVRVVSQLDTRFQGYDIDADGLLLIEVEESEELLVHIEFQSVADKEMPERLLDYCFRAHKKYGNRPIISCVIYLRNGGTVHEPPYAWEMKNGRKLLAFDYLCIKLYEEESDKLLALDQPAILPLTLLTKGGASRTIVGDVFNQLQANGLRNLFPVTHVLAGLAFKNNPANLDWLEREYNKMMDILKESPAYHWMTDDARNEGLAQGREEGRAKGREEGRAEGHAEGVAEGVTALRSAIASVIEKGFPELSKRTQKQLALIQQPAVLTKLIIQLYDAKTPEEVKRYLSEALEEGLGID